MITDKPYLLQHAYQNRILLGLKAEFVKVRRSIVGGRVARVAPFDI